MTREELRDLVARFLCEDMDGLAFDEVRAGTRDVFTRSGEALLAAIEAAGVRLVLPSEAQAQLIDGDERTTVRIFTPYALKETGQ